MALKFLNKKGWHTGSLRNIENVWKAEQKHNAEQQKLEDLRKQIQEERERAEFRQLQEQAGLVPRQERLDFLYESGLGVGKASEGFKALEAPTPAATLTPAAADASSSKAAAPGALFEEKPQTANDAWRKLHSDPLLLIRQREQEALARIKNNPVKMAMIRKSVEAESKKKDDKEKLEKKKHKRKHHHKKTEKCSDSENSSGSEGDGRKRSRPAANLQRKNKPNYSHKVSSEDELATKIDHPVSDRHEGRSSKQEKYSSRHHSDSRYSSESEEDRRKHSKQKYSFRDGSEDEAAERKKDHAASYRHKDRSSKDEKHSSKVRSDSRYSDDNEDRRKSSRATSEHHHQYSQRRPPSGLSEGDDRGRKHLPSTSDRRHSIAEPRGENNKNKETQTQDQRQPAYNRRKGVPKMTEEERQARLREMQLDAELHEEQRWKRIKTAAEADAQEAAQANSSRGKNFLDEAQKSIYGAEKGGSATIEESVRRRAYYSQGGAAAHETNAFRR